MVVGLLSCLGYSPEHSQECAGLYILCEFYELKIYSSPTRESVYNKDV